MYQYEIELIQKAIHARILKNGSQIASERFMLPPNNFLKFCWTGIFINWERLPKVKAKAIKWAESVIKQIE